VAPTATANPRGAPAILTEYFPSDSASYA